MTVDIERLREHAKAVLARALQDKVLLSELKEDPKQVLEKEIGGSIPHDIRVSTHKGLNGNMYIDVHSITELDSAELSIEDLAHVVGGNYAFNMTC